MSEAREKPRRHWFRTVRSILRRVRWCVWALALLVAVVIIYLSTHDLPDSVKQKLQAELHARGVDLEMNHLRWRPDRGFVAEDVRFGSAQLDANSPKLFIKEVELKLKSGAMMRLHFNEVESLILAGGSFDWRLSESNEPPEVLAITNIQARLQLETNDQWELNNFTAAFAGATLHLTGSVTNASAFRDWKLFQPKPGAPPDVARDRLRSFVRTANLIQYAKAPEINVMIRGDARDPQSFNSQLSLEATGATTPWGTLSNGQLNARLTPPGANGGPPQLEVKLRADEVDTRWGGARHFQAELHAAGEETGTNLIQAHLEIVSTGVDTPWIQATNARFSARWTHSLTNPIPDSGKMELLLTDTRSPWATADEFRLTGTLATPSTNQVPRPDESWGWWAYLAPCAIDWTCRFAEIRAQDFESKELSCGGNWRAPQVTLTNLHSEMYRGTLRGNAGLNVSTRQVNFDCSSDFDLQKACPFLTPEGQRWVLEQAFQWSQPPVIHASGSAVLPLWSERKPDWGREILPTANLQGDFSVGAGSFREVPVNSAASHFSYSNMTWNLPDLVITRPEGHAHLTLLSADRTKDFYCHITSDVDVKALRGLLDTNVQKGMDFLTYTKPPAIDMELWGRWKDYDRIGFKGKAALGDFSFRGETANSLKATLSYTNRFLVVTDGRVERPDGFATVAGVGVDIEGRQAFMTNAYGTMDPMAVVRTLGPKITALMEPYHFAKPPVISAHGVIPLSDDISMADLHFNIDGGPFAWLKFHSQHVGGTVDWVGETLHVNLAQAEFYGGTLGGTADFDFRPKEGADFKFDMTASGADFHRLMADVGSATNKVEGTLGGHLVVTEANSEHLMDSWKGSGWAELKDGYIWDIPVFGVLSPLLDSVSPGLGKSRAREGRASFTITNSVVRTDDLEIHSSVLRIRFRGTVGFDNSVNATEEAEVGRDMPLFGPVLSSMLIPFTKLFESKVTGTLQEPKSEPKWMVTKMMIMPIIHPWRTIKDLFPGENPPNPASAIPIAPSAPPSPAAQ